MSEPAHVLVATLGVPGDHDALSFALESFPDAAVTLLSVVAPADARVSEGRVLERGEQRLDAARDRAADLRAGVDEPGRVTIRTREGQPTKAIPAFVRETDVDHVVVPGQEAHWFLRRLLGESTPQLLEERIEVPVTILP